MSMTPRIDVEQVIAPLRSAAWQAEAEARLQALVEISSHSADRAGCQAMAGALCELLALPDLSVERRPDAAGRHGDHVAAVSAAGAGPFVLLIGHHDTVFPAGAFSGYRVSEEGGVRRAHGPGVYDMKGGLVTIAFALRALSAAGLLRRVPLRQIGRAHV